MALFDDDVAIGEAFKCVDILVDDKDRLTVVLETFDAGPNFFTDEGRNL